LLYPEPKFHDHPALRYPQPYKQKQTNKQKNKLNITPNATLYGEITTPNPVFKVTPFFNAKYLNTSFTAQDTAIVVTKCG